jgi:CheY-like chemotaxis protein
VVDDVDVVRLVLRRMLVKGGHSVIEAGDTAAAKALLREGRCQVVVTDLWLPGGDGVSLIREIKANWPRILVVAMTGGAPSMPTALSFEAAAKAGADRFLLKPIARDELLEAVATSDLLSSAPLSGDRTLSPV